MLSAFGPNVNVQGGERMLGLSSGTARAPTDFGYQSPGGFNKTPDMYRLLGGLLGVERRSAVAPADLPTVVHEPQGCCLQRSANP